GRRSARPRRGGFASAPSYRMSGPSRLVVVFRSMTDGEANDERRHVQDRRSTPRGGRRPADPMGYSPLVLVADDDADNGARSVAILARLRFAVAPAHSV